MWDNTANDLQLTHKEAQLLSLLRRNPGTCFSRNYLLQTIWGYRPGVRSRTVDVHIWRLRQKLGSERGGSLHTVLRRGYCWQADAEPTPGVFTGPFEVVPIRAAAGD